MIIGGRSGIMKAANKGTAEVGGYSVGLNIKLPLEQEPNSYAKRKVMMAKYSTASVFFPGSYGTMDKMFEILTLVQTREIRPIPIVLIDKNFWNPLYKWMTDYLIPNNKISFKDVELFKIVDTPEEAVKYIKDYLWI